METCKGTISENGWIFIPSVIRKAMDLHPGDELSLSYDDANLQIKTRKQVIEDARRELQLQMNVPEGVSLVDELIKERREDAAKEQY